ncbi:MAG: hypothetical protein WD845_03250 [Pirellulales bacterium]
MRLTLRTMLAYLDDILDPQDSEDIAKKIEESEFATELVHRTRDSMRRLRLGVPPLVGKGLASDSNTVAEYLDNTLPADRVAEFEKICLESDVHLAEVASCHQILTLVLGEPAAIDPQSRQRMYRVATEASAPPIQGDGNQPPVAARSPGAAPAAAAVVTPPAPPRRQRPEVPEYLRESRSRLWPVVAATGLGAVATIVLLVMFGPAEWRARVAGIAQADPAAEAPADEAVQSDTAAAAPAAGDTPAGDATPSPTAPQTGAPSDDAANVEPPVEPIDPSMPADAAGDATLRPADEVDMPRQPDELDPNAPPAPEPGADPAAMPEEEAEPAGLSPAAGTGLPFPDPDAPLPPEPMPPADAPAAPADAAAAPAETAFGRYTSKRGEVLLKLDRENGDWRRLPPMAPLAKGDRLLSLPLYRPSIALSTSLSIQPDGAAELEFVGWTPEGVPIVSVSYGRLLMMTVGKAGNSIQLKLGEQVAEITFVDAESTVAIEVLRILPPGNDPTKGLAPLNVDIHATSGAARVRLDSDPPLDLQAPAQRALLGAGIAPPGETPAWVTSEVLSDPNRLAMQTVEGMLPPEQFVGLILKELSTHRRREVRALAIRSATYLNNFEPCINALSEKDEKNLWPTYIEELRASIARSPETATAVRNTFDKQRGADGEALSRMLWGYSADDLQDGAAAQLVEGLNNDGLDYRVLAIWNLRDITGEPNHAYYPENLTRQRTASVNTWKDLLRRGKIVPKAVAAATRAKGSSD